MPTCCGIFGQRIRQDAACIYTYCSDIANALLLEEIEALEELIELSPMWEEAMQLALESGDSQKLYQLSKSLAYCAV
jgi:hypothetical protein